MPPLGSIMYKTRHLSNLMVGITMGADEFGPKIMRGGGTDFGVP